MRGLPGSGKSYLANQIAGKTGQAFSADDYHVNPRTGKYKWKPENVSPAHQWNYNRIKKAIESGMSPVVVDNTNTTAWELKNLSHSF